MDGLAAFCSAILPSQVLAPCSSRLPSSLLDGERIAKDNDGGTDIGGQGDDEGGCDGGSNQSCNEQ